MQRQLLSIVVVLFWTSLHVAWAEMPYSTLQAMFQPYADGKPSVEGLAPGTKIEQDSWQGAQDYLPAGILDKIKAAELAFEVQETTALPVSEAYITATHNHSEQVQLGADGELDGYVAGLPFPVLDPTDDQAGLKAAWNLRCLLYTSPSPRDRQKSRMPSSA